VILYPAIDILDGCAVRLVQGDFGASKVYDEDPLSAARGWVQAGAEYLHVVDLDGARTGEPVNLEHLSRIVEELKVPVQYGGGLRTLDAVDGALAAGAGRAILGTAAFTDPDLLERALAKHGPKRVLVSLDLRGSHVATAGWTQTTESGAAEAVAGLRERGVRELVYTNVDRDGMLEGPDIGDVHWVTLAAEPMRVIYSGGIGRREDLQALADLPPNPRRPDEKSSLAGVIVGKALYERRFTVAEAREALGA
jgi:phosphoribosylformimino-5-aminoimidazole carboxamide ribotide isomerase